MPADTVSADGTPAAYYAKGTSGFAALWTLLHPPYTIMHLSFVVVGAALAPTLNLHHLAWTLLAFLLAMGLAAHALDELHGRPLKTRLGKGTLIGIALVGLVGASGAGLYGAFISDLRLLYFIPVGAFLVVAYNSELFGGRFHNADTFALAWGAFPVVVGGFAQTGAFTLPMLLAGAYGYALSRTQRTLSDAARHLRRRATRIDGTIHYDDGQEETIDLERLIAAPERALRWLVWVSIIVAAALVAMHVSAGTWVWSSNAVGTALKTIL